MPIPVRPARPVRPDAVDVGVAVLGRVEVDHVGDALHVDAARCDVGGHQGATCSALEARERLLALRLRLVAVHGTACTPCAFSRLTSRSAPRLVRTNTSVRESCLARSARDQRVELGLVGDRHEAVLDLGPLRRGRVLVAARASRVYASASRADLAVERGREEEGLAVARRSADDPVDGGPEAHVEHAVGLVEHEHADAVEAHGAARDQVLEAARRGDDDVRLRALA